MTLTERSCLFYVRRSFLRAIFFQIDLGSQRFVCVPGADLGRLISVDQIRLRLELFQKIICQAGIVLAQPISTGAARTIAAAFRTSL